MTTKITAEQIRARLKALNMSMNEAAEKLDMTRQNINKHLSAPVLSDFFIWQFETKIGMTTKDSITSNAVMIDESGMDVMYVPVVNEYAYAGYQRGFANAEFVDALPKIPWTVDQAYKGRYICFVVSGDSMDDNSRDSYIEGDVLLCREIKPDLWMSSKLHIRKWDFVIVHKTEGIVVKKIIEHNVEKGIIKLHSLNDYYPDFEVALKDVQQIFNVVQVKRKK